MLPSNMNGMNLNNTNNIGFMMFQNNVGYNNQNNNNISNSMNINAERINQNNINNIHINQSYNNLYNNSNYGNISLNNMPNSARFNYNFSKNFNNNNYNNNNLNNNLNNNIFNNNCLNNNNYNNNYNNNLNNNIINNLNNNFNYENNLKINQMKDLFNKFNSLDPYEFQKKIAANKNNQNKNHQFNDPFHSSSKEKECDNPEEDSINIVFVMMKGNKHIKNFKNGDTIRIVLEKFVKSLDIHVNTLKEIYFLFNATNLNNINPDKTINELGIRNFTRINVIDMKNIIGS